MRIAISIPDPVFEAAERSARRLVITRSELYARAVEQFLKRLESQDVTTKLNDVYEEESSTLDPVLERWQAAAIAVEIW
jgi:antitoxin MazE6